MKVINIITIIVLAILIFAKPSYCADCIFEYKDEDIENNTSVYETENDICKAEIKAGYELFTFTEDGCDHGYCVTGIGTHSGVATVEESDLNCHPVFDISHVRWHTIESTTPVRILSFRSLNLWQRLFGHR
jgi:hypothetical protein